MAFCKSLSSLHSSCGGGGGGGSPSPVGGAPRRRAVDVMLQEFLGLPPPQACHRGNMALFASALTRDNFGKNRYPDVLPYEPSRVLLSSGQYINASVIPVNGQEYGFIASQAPLPHTFNEFWFMIWETKISAVVMLTRLLERRKIKAHCYWPNNLGEKEMFGDIRVELVRAQTEVDEQIVIRTFQLTHNVTGESRTVDHIHYTEWPDFGVPGSTATIRKVLDLISKYQSNGPVLVHCSAGIGRAGTLIAISTFLSRHAMGELGLSVRQIVEDLRKYRPGMVQTKEQYFFIYDTIEDALEQQQSPLPSSSVLSSSLSSPLPMQQSPSPQSSTPALSVAKPRFPSPINLRSASDSAIPHPHPHTSSLAERTMLVPCV